MDAGRTGARDRARREADVSDVLFLRELVADRDIVFAFDRDGSPAWAMDLDSQVQWWYAAEDRARIRAAVAEQWESFPTMPLTAATNRGAHPAIELGRRVDAAATVEMAQPQPPWPRRWWDAVAALPPLARLGAALGLVLLGIVVLPWTVAFLTSAPGTHHPIDPSPTDAPAIAVAATACPARGLISHDADGHVLVCIPPSEAQPSLLEWRAAG